LTLGRVVARLVAAGDVGCVLAAVADGVLLVAAT
jgi:hypothetical protein